MAAKSKSVGAEREAATQALRESESQYRTLVENLPQKIFFKDRDSVYVSCNENYANDMGIAPGDMVGKSDYEFYPKDLADKYRADDGRVLESGQTEEIVEKYAVEGEELWVNTIKTPVRDDRGEVTGILGIFWDITERRRTQEALQESEERNRLAMEAATVGSWESTFGTGEITWSDTAARLYGFGPEDLTVPRDLLYQRIHPEDRNRVRRTVEDTTAEDGRYDIEYRVVWPDGSVHWMVNKGQVYRDEEGQPQRMLGVSVDVTPRKEAELELQKHKDHLEELVQERTRKLAAANTQLEQEIAEGRRREEIIEQQGREILELSTPVMQLWDGVVAAPLIGTLDSQRAQQFMEVLLQSIVQTDSQVALVDITGVPTIDTQTAQNLIETVSAVKLLGAQVVLTGVRPAIAQTLVHLGIDLTDVTTRPSLASGLRVALDILGATVNRDGR